MPRPTSQALVGPQGEVTIAGSGGAQHNGSFVRILPDGSLGFATFPGFGCGLGSVFLPDSLAELPTTGYVAGATHVKFNGIAPDDLDGTGLVGLDAAGHIRWAMRYSFGAPGAYVRSGPTAVHLSDDGCAAPAGKEGGEALQGGEGPAGKGVEGDWKGFARQAPPAVAGLRRYVARSDLARARPSRDLAADRNRFGGPGPHSEMRYWQ